MDGTAPPPRLYLLHLLGPAAVLLAAARAVAGEGSPVAGAWRFLGLAAGLWLAGGLAVLATRRGREWARRRGAGVLAATVTGAVLLPAVEVALRFQWWGGLRPPHEGEIGHRFDHPTRGWANPPDERWEVRTMEFRREVAVNSHGYRDLEHPRRPEPGVFRIVALGDSFLEAVEVEFEETLARQLERRLAERRVEVVNLGVRAYGTAQQLRLLEEEGLAWEPDLVLLAFFLGNDVRNNCQWMESRAWGPTSAYARARPYASIDPGTGDLAWTPPDLAGLEGSRAGNRPWLVLKRLPIPRFLRRSRGALHAREPRGPADTWDENLALADYALEFDPSLGRWGISADEYRARHERAWAVTVRLLTELRQRCDDAGVPSLVVLIPPAFAVGERPLDEIEGSSLRVDLDLASRRFAAAGPIHGMPTLDLTAPLRAAVERGEGPFYFPVDRHWTAAGHSFAADHLAAFLTAAELVPHPPPNGAGRPPRRGLARRR